MEFDIEKAKAKLEIVEIQNEKKDIMKLAESLEELLKNPVP